MSDTLASEPLEGLEDSSGRTGGQKRLLLLVGGLAALLVVGLGVYFLFLSGGSDEEELEVISGAPAPVATENGSTKGGDTKGETETVPASVKDDFAVGRDPFAPLPAEEVIVVAEPAPTDDTTTDTTTGTTITNGSGTGTGTAPNPTPTASPDPSPTPDPVTSYKVTVRSVDVAKDSAIIEVNGKRYVVQVKDMFTNSKTGPFKLTRVGELPSGKDTATVVFGDDAPVELVAKDTVVFK